VKSKATNRSLNSKNKGYRRLSATWDFMQVDLDKLSSATCKASHWFGQAKHRGAFVLNFIQTNLNMKFDKAIPILYSQDVSKSITYFIEQLKFENKWEWENPPTFGGVYRDNVEIFFCKDHQGSPATWLSLVVDNVDEYYELINESGAKILSSPDSKQRNMREMLVECPDGHIIRFGHNTSCD
jgi:hypothetical protein